MYINIEEPTETISNDAVKVWRMSNTIGHLSAILIIAVLVVCSEKFGWYGWIGIVLYFLSWIYKNLYEVWKLCDQ